MAIKKICVFPSTTSCNIKNSYNHNIKPNKHTTKLKIKHGMRCIIQLYTS